MLSPFLQRAAKKTAIITSPVNAALYSGNNMNSFLTLLISLTLFISGCSSSTSESNDNELFGVWVSSCFIGFDDQPSKSSIEFSEQQVTTGTIYFNDYDCIELNTDIETTQSTSSYRLGQEFMTIGGNKATEIDVDFYIDDDFMLTVKDIVSVINSQLYLGAYIPDNDCNEFEQIAIGSDFIDICNQRPTELNFDSSYYKQ